MLQRWIHGKHQAAIYPAVALGAVGLLTLLASFLGAFDTDLQSRSSLLPQKNPRTDTSSKHESFGNTWSYSGELGPESWSNLDEQFKTCTTGQQQSPINIPNKIKPTETNVKFKYAPEPAKISHSGHTIDLALTGKSSIVLNNTIYHLRQIQFHTPSEHTVRELMYPMELHLIHASEDGRLAIVGVLIEKGTLNQEFAKVLALAPNSEQNDAATIASFDPVSFIPSNLNGWHYQGSVTHPPCTEGVHWTILSTTLEFSAQQIADFRKIFPMNTRPVQPLYQRSIQSVEASVSH